MIYITEEVPQGTLLDLGKTLGKHSPRFSLCSFHYSDDFADLPFFRKVLRKIKRCIIVYMNLKLQRNYIYPS